MLCIKLKVIMKTIRWNLDKAKKIKLERNISIEKIAVMIEDLDYIGIMDISSRPGQKMFLLDYNEYIVCVPFVETDEEIFIKTAYRNRKINKNIKVK